METYTHAELAILAIIEECETVQFVWRRIAQWASEHLHQIDGHQELGGSLERSIYCGELVVPALEEDLVTVVSKSNNVKRRVRPVWNNSVFAEHQARIRGQIAALQLLLQVIRLEDTHDLISNTLP
jgi:hypothetical protein